MLKLLIDTLIHGEQGDNRWIPALSNEWDRLAQGNNVVVDSTDTIEFISHTNIPQNKKLPTSASYVIIVY